MNMIKKYKRWRYEKHRKSPSENQNLSVIVKVTRKTNNKQQYTGNKPTKL